MASRGTWLVLALIAAIGIAAAVDALRGDDGAQPAAEEPPPAATDAAEEEPQAEELPFDGVLYYTDETCRLRAVRLPGLEEVEAPIWSECRFVLSPDGSRASGPGSGWDLHSDPRIGRLFQTEAETIAVATNRGPEGEPFPGRTAAWRPDGTLTYVADGAVRTWPAGEVVLSAADVAGAFGARAGTVRFDEIGWLNSQVLVAILRANAATAQSEAVVATFENGRPVWADFLGREGLSDLQVSPSGSFFSVLTPTGVLVYDGGGGALPVPALADVRALAFAPNRPWAAIATSSGVEVFRLGESSPAVHRLPLAARDLAWAAP